jgi:type VI secretion system protein VasG
MAVLNLKSLVGKLNTTCRQSLESAAGLCLSRTNYNVEIEHWLLKLLEQSGSDLLAILKYFQIDPSRFQSELMAALDKQKTGNGRPPALSQSVVDLAKDAWLVASVDFADSLTRSGHLLIALLSDDSQRRLISSEELAKINPETLKKDYSSVCKDTSEAAAAAPAHLGGGGKTPGKPTGPTKTPSLDQFTIDLTQRAKAGQIDPVLGRDSEIRQIIDILCRRRQNNPILTGEAGVGKTAVVEGFAQKIADGDVPPALQGVSLRVLDLALLQAGAGVKGEFENRLKSVIEEVKSSPTPIIIFIDEAHNMIGAGGSAGQGDAANLLKPALARGELRTIAATTWSEYKQYFEQDAALARRFQVVKVEEPDEKNAIAMMRGLAETLSKHHGIRILNEAIEDAVKLSKRYIAGRQLPDKSVSLLDTSCARISLSQSTTPPAIEDCQRQIQQLEVAKRVLVREAQTGANHKERIEEIDAQAVKYASELATLTVRWEQEKALVAEVNGLRNQLAQDEAQGANGAVPNAAAALTDAQRTEIITKLNEVEGKLRTLQGHAPLVHACCDSNAIAETVGSWTGIPVGRMMADEIQTILDLKPLLERQVVGQSHALEQIAESIKTSRAKLTDPGRPIGIFFLAGTSGVGKTETALALADLLYGGEQNLTVINMSEFKEEHKVSLLMGSPPGYVGYGKGGVLTEAVRRKPYSVVLLDEMEKAHPGIQDIFYQVFDKGHMKDSEGRDIDFKNTVVIMTSNAGTDLIKSLCADKETMPGPEEFTTAVYPELLKTFKPAFLGRVTIIPYYPLSDEIMKKIIRLKLGKVQRRVREHYKADLSYTDKLVDQVATRCTEVDTGARNVDKILNKTLLPELSTEFLSKMAEGVEISKVVIDATDEGGFKYDIS